MNLPAINITPVFDQIFVQVIEPGTKGLYVPPGIRPGPAYALVVAVGPGRPSEYSGYIIPMPKIEIGDTILFHGGAGTEFEVDGETFRAIYPRDVIGLVK